ncbi:MAG: tetratricopeptide repeat protein [Streptosporangiales bacterium]|nr:tetratricopeptide repeat protein [Streptosporangiales bacterium]
MSALARAQHLLDLDRPEQARTLVGEALAEDPDSVRAWLLLAQCHLGLHEPERGREAAGRALGLAPEVGASHQVYARTCTELGRHAEAVWHAREAVRLDPEDYVAHLWLADALLESRVPSLLPEAWCAANWAVELAPEETGPHGAVGVVAFAYKRWDVVVAASTHALRIDPTNAQALNNLAAARLRRGVLGGDPTRAAGELSAALAIDPGHKEARFNLDVIALQILGVVYWLSWVPWFVMFSLVMTEFAGERPELWPVRLVGGFLVAVLWAVLAGVLVRRTPRRVRPYLLRFPRRRWEFGALCAAAGIGVSFPVLAGLLPGPVAFTAVVVAVASILVSGLLRWTAVFALRRQGR